MKKRILAIAMCLILCLGLLPAVALANDYEALVSTTNPSDEGTRYTTLQEAFTATEQYEPNTFPVVKLLKNVTVSSALTLNQDINLFLNDCTLTIGSGATLTGNVSAQGYVDHQPMIDLWGGFDSSIGGSLVSSGTIEAFISTYGCEMTVSGGSITAMQMFGGTTTITGGTISDICVDDGTVNISGGSILNMEVMNNMGGPTVTISGSPVIEQMLLEFYDGNEAGTETVAISGTPQIGLGKSIDCQNQETGTLGSLTITGGCFRADPTVVFPADTEHVTVSIGEVTDLGAEAGTYRYQVGSDGGGTSSGGSGTSSGETPSESEFTVCFDTDGGTAVAAQTVAAGGKATRPSVNPTKSGYTFVNWYNADKTAVWNFDTPIGADTVICAVWQAAYVYIPEYYYEEPAPAEPALAETTSTTENADGSVTEKTTATETEKNADGTETTKATETATTTAADGAVTETKSETKETLDASGNGTVEATRTEVVKDTDGKVLGTTVTESKGTVETDENGTKTTTTVHTATTTDADGNETTTVTTEQKGETADGTTGVVVTDADGNLLSAEATVSEGAVEAAKESGAPVQLPMEVPPAAAENAETAAPVAITLPAALTEGGSVAKLPRVEIAVPKHGPGIVAMIRSALGKLIPIKECYEGSVIVPVSGSCEIVIVDNTKTFGDVAAGAWYEDYVTFVTAREIFNGVGGGAFDPEGSMTRGMVAQVLFNYTRGAVLGDASAFPDISADDWFNGAVGWLVASGVAQGRGEVFDAVSPITREELAVMLFNYAKAQGYDVSIGEDTNILSFSDALDVSDWAYPAMQWAVGAGLIQGVDGALLPQAYASRAQVAAMMQRFVENVR